MTSCRGGLGASGGDALGSPAGDRHLMESFQALMQQPDMAAPDVKSFDASEVAATLIREQNAQFVNVNRSMMETLSASPALDVMEMHAQSMRMSFELASMHLDMAAKLGVVGASKSAIETLMKNQ
ncbi:hypothetical protein [Burkholderia ubonensis]|uniref:hypothetical protein n=1 Tax=Burkholderia ubonensis TaxID=101571 RepID=UPI0007C718AA|nr:hypothetical protein [Burkholderia ubonensis]